MTHLIEEIFRALRPELKDKAGAKNILERYWRDKIAIVWDITDVHRAANERELALTDKEAAEIRVLESYLPPSADPAVVEHAVIEAIAETGATSPKDMGRVMKAAMAKLAGQSVDGKAVNELVRQKLAGA